MAHEDLGFVENSGSEKDHSDLGFVPDTSTSASQAGLEHFGNAASLGYLPHLQSAVEPAMSKILDLITGNDVSKDLPGYIQRRDENIKRMGTEEKEHPTASKVGSIAGSIAGGVAMSPLLPGVGATSVLGKAGQAALQGGLIGAAANPGDTEGKLSGLQLGDRAKDAALAGAVAGGTNLLAQGAGALSGKAKDALSSTAEEKAFKALDPSVRAVMKNQDSVHDIGRTLLDKDIIGGRPVNYQTLADRISEAKASVPAGIPESARLSVAEELAKNAAAKQFAGGLLGLKDIVAGSGGTLAGEYLGEKIGGHKGGVYGGLIGGALGSGASKFGHRYLPQIEARGADSVSNLLGAIQSMPESAANPAVIAALLNQAKEASPGGEPTSAMQRRLNNRGK